MDLRISRPGPFLRMTQRTSTWRRRSPTTWCRSRLRATNCTWVVKQLVDPIGRALYAEHPVLALDGQNRPVITFRGTGFDGELQPLDAPGMASGFGDLAQVTVSWPSAVVVPHYLTGNGAVNWLPSAAYDPVLDNTLSMAAVGPVPDT